jgi:predicted nicotinamide N-methyase
MAEGGEAEVLPLTDFFICRDYHPKEYLFAPPPSHAGLTPVRVLIDVLESASTDFDLTGQIVWSVSLLVSQYLCFPGRAECLAADAVLELGAGCGLAGLSCAAFGCPSVLLTDNEPEVLGILERSVQRYSSSRVLPLSWGDDLSHAALEAATGGRKKFPLLIGADVIYWSHSIPPLFDTVARLLSQDGVFILGFTNRRNGLKDAAEAAALAAGLEFTTVDPATFLPDPCPEVFTKSLHLVTLYRMKLRGT